MLPAWIRVLRPEQWIKNVIVLAALVFAYCDVGQGLHGHGLMASFRVLGAMVLFCITSSGIYIFNDICDCESDRRHPFKCKRPIAAGEIQVGTALVYVAGLLTFATSLSLILSSSLAIIIASYILIQLLYTKWFKHVAMLDVFIISLGFVMRAISGAVVISVRISPWLLVCTFLLALFLALCKRRQEKVTKAEHEQRVSLKNYNIPLLDQLISISASSTLVTYVLYTLSEETVARFGTPLLGLTIPFVAFGLFRYIHLVYVNSEGERPESVVFSDGGLIATIIGYGIMVVIAFLRSIQVGS